MIERKCFGVLDLMILVAGTAFAFWIVPEAFAIELRTAAEVLGQFGWTTMSAKWIGLVLTTSQPIVAVGTATLLVLALRRSRSFIEFVDGPGSMGCIAAFLVILIVGLLNFSSARINLVAGLPLSIRIQVYVVEALTFRRGECGIAVASAWLALLLIGHRFPRGDWIDRCGFAFGLFWVLMLPISRLGFRY